MGSEKHFEMENEAGKRKGEKRKRDERRDTRGQELDLNLNPPARGTTSVQNTDPSSSSSSFTPPQHTRTRDPF